MELGRTSEARRNLAAEYERLRTERLGLQSGRSELSNEVEALRGALAEERETLARAVREASSREEQLEVRRGRRGREAGYGAARGMGVCRCGASGKVGAVCSGREALVQYVELWCRSTRRGCKLYMLASSGVLSRFTTAEPVEGCPGGAGRGCWLHEWTATKARGGSRASQAWLARVCMMRWEKLWRRPSVGCSCRCTRLLLPRPAPSFVSARRCRPTDV